LLDALGREAWNPAYRFESKQQKLAFGPCSLTWLKDGRPHPDEAECLLAKGLDRSAHKHIAKFAVRRRTVIRSR